MSTLSLVLWLFALFLAVFGLIFVGLGKNSERSYWSQRDPSGDARTEATTISAIIRKEWHYATGEYRAPVRLMAIGVLVCELAIGFAVLALLTTWAF